MHIFGQFDEKRKQKRNMLCNIALNVNFTLKWNVKARYEAFWKTSFFYPGYTKNSSKKVLRMYLIEVVLLDFFFFVDPLEKLLLKYSNMLHTTAKSINFHRHYILGAVHHSDMRQTKVIMQSKRATTTTNNFGHNFNLKFCRCHTKLCHSVRNTFTWVQ